MQSSVGCESFLHHFDHFDYIPGEKYVTNTNIITSTYQQMHIANKRKTTNDASENKVRTVPPI